MRHRPRSVGDPVADDREHQVATHLHYASSSFFITVFNPVTVMAFGAAFAGRNLAGVGASLPDAALLVAAVFCGALAWWTIICTASVSLRARFTGTGLLWLNRVSGAIILGFGAGGADLAAAAAVEADRPQSRPLGPRLRARLAGTSRRTRRCCPFCSTPQNSRTRS